MTTESNFRWSAAGALRFAVGALAAMVVGAVLGLVYASVATPVYRAEVVLMPERDEEQIGGAGLGGGFGGLASLAGVSLGSDSQVQIEAIATLQSKSFVTTFLEASNGKQVLFPELWNDSAGSWINGVPSDNMAYDRFYGDVMTIREDASTGLTTLRVDWYDPEIAARWANGIATMLNAVMRERARTLANASIEYLETELGKTSNTSVQQAIGSLMEKQVTKIMMANVRPEFAFRVIDPATVGDIDDPLRPKRLLMVLMGGVFGLFLFFGIYAFASSFRRIS